MICNKWSPAGHSSVTFLSDLFSREIVYMYGESNRHTSNKIEIDFSIEMGLLLNNAHSQFSRLPFWSPYIIICIKIMKLLSKTPFAFRIEPECCQRQINKCGKYNCEKYTCNKRDFMWTLDTVCPLMQTPQVKSGFYLSDFKESRFILVSFQKIS